MAVNPVQTVAGATRQPIPYGLFSVVTPREGEDPHWQLGAQWDGTSCEPLGGVRGAYCNPDGTDMGFGFPKSLERSETPIGEANAFTVYGHEACTPRDLEDAQRRAVDHLLTREEHRVEQAFWTGDLENTPSLQSPDTVTLGAAAVSPKVGIALLEKFLADTYGSLGVIHMSRFAATMLHDVLGAKGKILTTNLGTPVVAGSGYPGTGPAGEEPASGQVWVYATPAVFGHRSDVFTASNRSGDLLNRSTNDHVAIAERTYLLGFDLCGVAAVLIDTNI